MTIELQRRIDYSIALLRKAEPLALSMDSRGFHLAFSGGKDSQVLYHIAQMAGVKFHAQMQVTTLDPPELMAFVRKNYLDVELNRPEINFYKLIEKKKMLPLRQARYCCAVLKEQAGAGTCTLLGIRAAESSKRANRNEIERIERKAKDSKSFDLDQWSRKSEQMIECVGGKDKIVVSPIHNWTDADVWNFLRGNEIEYCKLYDEGFHRIGCMFCPMANVHTKALERLRYPGVERAIKRSIQKLIDENGYMNNHTTKTDDIFDWWVSNKSAAEFFATRKLQTRLFL